MIVYIHCVWSDLEPHINTCVPKIECVRKTVFCLYTVDGGIICCCVGNQTRLVLVYYILLLLTAKFKPDGVDIEL